MIGNLGKVAYTHISKSNENYGNNENHPCKTFPLRQPQKEAEFPLFENGTGTVGTATNTSLIVLTVPARKYSYGNQRGKINSIGNQPLINSVPLVPAVPIINAVTSFKPATCPWCKSPDLWLVDIPGTTWRCRRCHPPVPGAERILPEPQEYPF